MTRTKKILGAAALVLVAGIAALAVAVSRDAPCGPSAPLASGVPTMKAIIHPCYGKADVLRYEDVAVPRPGDHEVLVEVRAVALNPLDWHYMTGTPYIMRLNSGLGRPKSDRLGVDFAGVVAAVGPAVTRFKPGDEVLGSRFGAFAEYAVVAEDRALVPKPPRLSFEQAAAVPVAAITALQGLRDKGSLRSGQSVLVVGASGGVGTFAVQVARALGAQVAAVVSTRNLELARSLGADQVIDYTQEDFTRSGRRYDLVFTVNGYHPIQDYRRTLTPQGRYLMAGMSKEHILDGMFQSMIVGPLISKKDGQKFGFMGIAHITPQDLEVLAGWMAEGKLNPVIEKRYPLSQTAEALRYLGTGHVQGKLVITVA